MKLPFSKSFFFCLFALFLTQSGFSFSTADTSDVDQFFDDGGISNGNNLVKLNFIDMANGSIGVQYERVLLPTITFLAGYGIQTAHYFGAFPDLFEVEFPTPTGGRSILFQARLYYSDEAPFGWYVYGGYRDKTLEFDDGGLNFQDFMFGSGYQDLLGERILWGNYYGIGIRNAIIRGNDFKNWTSNSISKIFFNCGLEIALIF